VPYFSTDVKVNVANDATTKMQHTSYYNGLDTLLYRFDLGKAYTTYPRVSTRQCQIDDLGNDDSFIEWLPDLADSKTWQVQFNPKTKPGLS